MLPEVMPRLYSGGVAGFMDNVTFRIMGPMAHALYNINSSKWLTWRHQAFDAATYMLKMTHLGISPDRGGYAPPVDGSSTEEYDRWCSHLANASKVGLATASRLLIRLPLSMAV